MFQRILVPTDGSAITAEAVRTAVRLAALAGAEIDVLAVQEPFPYSAIPEMQPVPPQEFFDDQQRLATARVHDAVAIATAAGVACHGHVVESGHPWQAILDHVRARSCDLVVMASHGRGGVTALLLGSQTQKVLTHSTVPVLVVR